jgi:hypothetical protein
MQHVTTAWRWLHEYGLLAPLAQLVLATAFGFVFAERWQRWRQRRDFQYRTLVKFSDLTYEIFDKISALLMLRGGMPPDVYLQRQREMVSTWTMFAAMRGEVMASYGRHLLLSEPYQGLFRALDTLREYVRASESVPQTRFEPVQERYLAHRETVVAEMVRAMGLVSKEDYAAELEMSRQRLQASTSAAAARVQERRG